MARLRTNLIANFAGAIWSAGIQLICTPLLIKLLGIEAYGLVGFFLTLQVSSQVFDLGFSATINRELAKRSMLSGQADETRDFLRTLEIGYWLIGLVISLAIVLFAPVISTYWLKIDALPSKDVGNAIVLMGLTMIFQWPLSFYQGGVMGLRRLVELNAVRIASATLNMGGAIFALWLISPSIKTFLVWQLVGNMLQVMLMRWLLWRGIPIGQRRPRFDLFFLREALPFTRGMSGIMVLGIVLTQMDKIVLSRFLPLAEFGFYTAAGVIVGGLQLFITPIFSAIFPQMSRLVVKKDIKGISNLYHTSTQLMATCLCPTAIVLAAFARPLFDLWTGNPGIATKVAPIAVLLLLGSTLNGLMNIPYALQLAYGWTKLVICLSLFEILAFGPILIGAAMYYGALGVAAVWVGLNFFNLIVGAYFMHRRFLRGELNRWILQDIGLPFLGALIVVLILSRYVHDDVLGIVEVLQLIFVGLISALAAGLCAPQIRAILLRAGLPF